MQAQRLDRLIELDLLAGDGETGFGDGGGNVAGVNGAVKLSRLAGLADHDHGKPFQFLAHFLGFGAVFKVGGLKLGALHLEMLLVGVGGAQGLFLGQQVIARVAGLDLHHVAHLTELFNPFQQNDFHRFRSLSTWRAGGPVNRCRYFAAARFRQPRPCAG